MKIIVAYLVLVVQFVISLLPRVVHLLLILSVINLLISSLQTELVLQELIFQVNLYYLLPLHIFVIFLLIIHSVIKVKSVMLPLYLVLVVIPMIMKVFSILLKVKYLISIVPVHLSQGMVRLFILQISLFSINYTNMKRILVLNTGYHLYYYYKSHIKINNSINI